MWLQATLRSVKLLTFVAAIGNLAYAGVLVYLEYENEGNFEDFLAHVVGSVAYLGLIIFGHHIDRFPDIYSHFIRCFCASLSAIFCTLMVEFIKANSKHVTVNTCTSIGILLLSISLSRDDYGGSSLFISYVLSYIVTTKVRYMYVRMFLYALISSSKYVIMPFNHFLSKYVEDKIESSRLQAENASKESEISCVKQPLDARNSEIARLRTEYASMESELSLAEQQAGSIKSKIIHLQTEYASMQSELSLAEQQAGSIKSKIIHLQTEYASMQSELSLVEHQVNSLNSEIERLQEEYNCKESELSQAKHQVESRQYEIALLEAYDRLTLSEISREIVEIAFNDQECEIFGLKQQLGI